MYKKLKIYSIKKNNTVKNNKIKNNTKKNKHQIKKIFLFIIAILFLFSLSCFINNDILKNNSVSKNDSVIKNSENNLNNANKIDFSIYQNNCIVIYGDSRTNHKIHRKIVNFISNFKPVAVFNTGDLVYNGNSKNQWEIFDNITKNLRKESEYYPGVGNHDGNGKYFYERFPFAKPDGYYYIDIKDFRFVMINSSIDLSKKSMQYKWLIDTLEKSNNLTKKIILLFHHPLFSTGKHREDEKGLKDILLPLIEKYNIKAVFSGHDHCYEKTFYKGTYFITTGGGGAPLYKQTRKSEYSLKYMPVYHFIVIQNNGEKTIFKVFDINLKLIDIIEFKFY